RPNICPTAAIGSFAFPTCWSSRSAGSVGERAGGAWPRRLRTPAFHTDNRAGGRSEPTATGELWRASSWIRTSCSPSGVMDLMLALTEDAVHEVVWTDTLLDEWERVIVREQHRSAASAARITAAIRECFADSRVPDSAYAHLLSDMPGADP